MKGLVTRNTHMKYERSITFGLEVVAKVKFFVHATDADCRAMTLAPRTYMSRLTKNDGKKLPDRNTDRQMPGKVIPIFVLSLNLT